MAYVPNMSHSQSQSHTVILLHQFTLPPKFSERVSQAGHCMNSPEGQRFSFSPQVQVSAVTNGRDLV